jgi:hypothetical protein
MCVYVWTPHDNNLIVFMVKGGEVMNKIPHFLHVLVRSCWILLVKTQLFVCKMPYCLVKSPSYCYISCSNTHVCIMFLEAVVYDYIPISGINHHVCRWNPNPLLGNHHFAWWNPWFLLVKSWPSPYIFLVTSRNQPRLTALWHLLPRYICKASSQRPIFSQAFK